ncbi:MAG: T9SS type A sorting domain-containing protein [Chitinophagaceae bacterium]|nr:T9SS type A sorting domain-containing protein [Chitinophagaceae bacterium]
MNAKKLTLTVCFLLVVLGIQAENFWTIYSSDYGESIPGRQLFFPSKYSLAQLETEQFKTFQLTIPDESAAMYATMQLPTPDGQFMTFKVFECQTMEALLAEKYPMIKTYTAISADNALITAKLDFTPIGFHAKVFNGEETWFIDPFKTNSNWYVVYYKKDYPKPADKQFVCEVDDNHGLVNEKALSLTNDLPKLALKQNGTMKKNYRLALACTIEYSAAVNTHYGTANTKANTLSHMVTSVNRVNGVFEREFSMHANLIANNDTLIFTTGTDPYTNNSGGQMLGQNQTTVSARIGSANYDFGHVFSTGGGGVATLASVCGNSKAQGVTGSSSPWGDPFDIDYVAHEMGHQFGGNHTFNSELGSCQGNRSSSSSFEIGSGTTIMAYAGICDADDIQPHSDDYYHCKSLEDMTGTSVSSCATTEASGNNLPTLPSVKQTYIIPYRTDFELIAPTGVDADGDPLTYCWEEYDKGSNTGGNTWDAAASSVTFAMQRSFYPSTNKTRTFPELKEQLKNTESYLGERLPENARLFRYRCTLRDLHNGWGGFYTSDSLTVDSRTTTSLFRVTSQNATGTTFNAWDQINITWDVAGTTAAPFNTANVDIMLSVDSGKTYGVYAPNTPNDGSQTIICPNVNANYARIKVKAAGNIYFDLNDKFFKITAAPASFPTVNGSEQFDVYPNPVDNALTIRQKNVGYIHEIKILDFGGRVCKTIQVNGSQTTIPTADLARGIYMADIESEGKHYLVRFVK